MRGSSAQAPMSAPASPTRTKRNAMRDPGVASRRSDAMARMAPAPAQTPSTAATIGAGQARMARTSPPVMRVNASRPAVSPTSAMATRGPMISCTSPPEQKSPPVPVSTTARTSPASTATNQSVNAL